VSGLGELTSRRTHAAPINREMPATCTHRSVRGRSSTPQGVLPQLIKLTRPCALLALGALALCGGARAQMTSPPDARAAAASHLQVTQIEYRLILSRGVVKAGRVSLRAIDAGMDPHDLRLRRSDSRWEIIAPELTSGAHWDGIVSLRPGTYRLWCSLPEHATLGMRTTLRVVR
jgi:hypothetical protein